MLNRSFVTRLAAFALLLVFITGCAAQPVAPTTVDKTGAAAPAASGVLAGGAAPASQVAQSVPASGAGVTVVGTGTATGAPDQANISIGVQTQSNTAQQAVSDNQTQMNTLLAALKALGIADKDLQTSNYSVYTENPQGQTGTDGKPVSSAVIYHVSNQVDVKVRDVSKLGDILDKAVTSGANSIYGVSFSVADTTKLQDQARAAAVADAKARAQSLASLEGLTLGTVVSISEVSAAPGPLYNAASGIGGGGGTPIQPGELNITVSLTVTYSIK